MTTNMSPAQKAWATRRARQQATDGPVTIQKPDTVKGFAIPKEGTAKQPAHIGLVETNRMIRKVLAANFPGVKFSVKGSRYSMGQSTRIGWTDGPTRQQVEDVVKVFESKSFDGMTDSTSYNRVKIDEHGNVYHECDEAAPADAIVAYSGTDYVFCDRRESN